MNREVVTSLYYHNRLISLVMLDRQRKPLMRTDIKRREIWEWSDHTQRTGVKYLDYSRFIDWPQTGFTLEDGGHPTAQGHRTVAAQLVKDLGQIQSN
jgi:lysophospholipase L1-like esterase